jgi:hypothetical protein
MNSAQNGAAETTVNQGASGGSTSVSTGTSGPNTGSVIELDKTVVYKVDANPPPAGECGIAEVEATLVRQAIDIILIVDNSGSMSEEIQGIQDNININFANILKAADIDYRVLLISQYGSAKERKVCIEAPLSGAPSCVPPPLQPVFSDRFFQYEAKVRSTNSLRIVLGAYRLDPLAKGDDLKELIDQSGLIKTGYHSYLRPVAKKVFIELSDDDADGMTAQEFDRKLLKLDPEQFGTEGRRKYVWHSIIGMAEKPNPREAYLPNEPIQQGMCGKVTTAGLHYQELSQLTGGLRFPICRPEGYDVVLRSVAANVIDQIEIACDFPIPPPPLGKTLDLDMVAVGYTQSPGAPEQTYAQVVDLASCQPNTFYIKNNQISLCPDTCSLLQQNPTALVKVLFTCKPTLVIVK